MCGSLEHVCVCSFLWAVPGPEDSPGFHFECDGGDGALSWSWRVVLCKLGKDHYNSAEQVPSPFSQDLGGREDSGPSLSF